MLITKNKLIDFDKVLENSNLTALELANIFVKHGYKKTSIEVQISRWRSGALQTMSSMTAAAKLLEEENIKVFYKDEEDLSSGASRGRKRKKNLIDVKKVLEENQLTNTDLTKILVKHGFLFDSVRSQVSLWKNGSGQHRKTVHKLASILKEEKLKIFYKTK